MPLTNSAAATPGVRIVTPREGRQAVARRACALYLLLIAPAALDAQAGAGPGRDGAPAATPPVVRDVLVQRRQVFELTDSSAWYERLLNRLHVTTREDVVRRELLVRPGKPYEPAEAAESERNLRQLSVFREVRVDSASSASGLAAHVVTSDAWTTKPYFSLRTAGTQSAYGIGLSESNLLGRVLLVGVRFKHEPDRNSLELTMRAPRVTARRISVAASYAGLSDGRRASLSTGLPFLSLSSRAALGADAQMFDGRILRFVGGNTNPSDSLRRKFAIARAQVGRALRAGPQGYLRVGLTGQLRREDFGLEPATDTLSRTITGAVSALAEARRARFIVRRNYHNIGAQEDVDLSTTLRLGASLAPRAWGYEHTGVGPLLTFRTGTAFKGGFATLDAAATTLYGSAGLDSGTFTVRGTGVLQPSRRQLAVFFLGGGRQKDPAPGAEFDLGLTRGPRAFPQHAFTGDRYFLASTEYRWTAIPELAKLVGIGVAAFADHGGAWFAGSPRRTGTDAGLGLRFGSTRSTSSKGMSRVDVAYRFPNDVESGRWVLVLGTGFVFERVR